MSKRKNIYKRLMITALSASIVAGASTPILVSGQGINQYNQNKIQTQTSQMKELLDFKISPDIDTKTSESVNIIVEFKSKSVIEQLNSKGQLNPQITYSETESASNAKTKVEKSHKDFKTGLENMKKAKRVSTYKIKHEYKEVYNGVSMTIPGDQVESLLEIPEVARIWKNYDLKMTNKDEIGRQDNLGLVIDEKAKSETKIKYEDKTKATETSIYDKVNKNSNIQPLMEDSISTVGVDKLHKEGIKGQGVKVGVIDTGIDYNHPDLTNSYKGFRSSDGNPDEQDIKQTIGWDFVDNDADPMETTYADWQETLQPEVNPYSGSTYYTSHGTHVSGTIAGTGENESQFAVTGLAPEVDLYGYRVLGPYGSGSTDAIIAAVEKSVTDGMDVINMSLGAEVNHPLYPTNIATNNATMAGVVTLIAAGNSGPNPGSVGSPGAAPLPITVGASSTEYIVPDFDIVLHDGTGIQSNFFSENLDRKQTELDQETFDFVYVGLGKEADFKGKDLSGKIALIDRGEITFADKIANATKSGAKAAIIVNNVEGELTVGVGSGMHIPGVSITKEDGEKIKSLIDSGNAKVKFNYVGDIKYTEEDELGYFSSCGPVALSHNIKPEIVAPGVDILSTYPEYINDKTDEERYDIAYSSISGTSMATPHIAGIAALILQENPNYTPEDVKVALMNNADRMNGEYAVNQIGAGRVNAYKSVHNDEFSIKVDDIAISMIENEGLTNENIIMVPDIKGSLAYGVVESTKTESAFGEHKVILENKTDEKRTYNITLEYLPAMFGGLDPIENGLRFGVESSVTVNPNSKRVIYPSVTIPNSAEIGYFQGNLIFTKTDDPTDEYRLPFSVVHNKVVERTTEIKEVAGDNPDDIAVNISKEIWGKGSKTAVIVNDDYINDGIVATPFAKALNAPILLSEKTNIAPITKDELLRLQSKEENPIEEVYIIGNTTAIGTSVEKELQDMGIKVQRISGKTEFETSLKVAQELDELVGDVKEAYVVNSTVSKDGISIAPVAATNNAPVILSKKGAIPTDALNWMKSENLEETYLIGTERELDKNVLKQLNNANLESERIEGSTKDDTNAAIIDKFYNNKNVGSVYVVNSNNIADGIGASVAASKDNGFIVLSNNEVTPVQQSKFENITSDRVYKTGSRVVQTVFDKLAELFRK